MPRFEDGRERYAILSTKVTLNPRLSFEARGVYAHLVADMDSDEETLDQTEPVVQNALVELVKEGVIAIDDNGDIEVLM